MTLKEILLPQQNNFPLKPIIGITPDIEGDSFRLRHEYVSAVWKSGGLPVILPPSDDIAGIAETIDGLLISGGNDILPEYYNEDISVPQECLKIVRKERTDFEHGLLNEVMKRDKPVLGICYGMQLINIAFGGALYQDIGHQVKGAQDHKSGEHGLKIVKHLDFCADAAYTVNSTHHQAVKTPGRGLEAFGLSEDGLIEGIYKPDYPFLIGVQWHPERIFYDKLSVELFKSFIREAKKQR
jgi:putative glutamine amidotransferase